jgi:hypothetical protein
MNAARSGSLPRVAIAIVGAGPRGTSVLERLLADVPADLRRAGLDIHVVDPYPPGAGRVWRAAQPPLLWMNSMTQDVAMFPDQVTVLAGPLRTGPTLWEWIRDVAPGLGLPPDVAAEVARAHPRWFASRPLLCHYLDWVMNRIVEQAPDGVLVHVYRTRVHDIVDQAVDHPAGREIGAPSPGPAAQIVHLDDGTHLTADAVVLALGHLDAGRRDSELARGAKARGLVVVPPHYAADADLDVLAPGEPVIGMGLGLGFVDALLLLTQGRGGRFERGPAGVLEYLPSGLEPQLHIGSRRGVPYHSKIDYDWCSERPPLPRHFTPAAAMALPTADGLLDLQRDLWPLLARELTWAYYHRLFSAHPDRVARSWREADAGLAALPPSDPALAALIARTVPDPADRLDLGRLDRPLDGELFTSSQQLQDRIIGHVEQDLRRRADPAHSADLALFQAFLVGYGVLADVLATAPATAASRATMDGWWHGLFSFYASGPPRPRAEELLAVARSGVLRFLGPNATVDLDAHRGVFRASSPALPGVDVVASALLQARQPHPSVQHADDVLVRRMSARGQYVEDVVGQAPAPVYRSGRVRVDAALRLIDAEGRPHPRRFAVGPWVAAGGFTAAFARPRTNAGFFRQNDALARAVLASVQKVAAASRHDSDVYAVSDVSAENDSASPKGAVA